MFYTLEIEAIGERKNYRAKEGSYAGGNFTPLRFISLLYIAGVGVLMKSHLVFYIYHLTNISCHLFFQSCVKFGKISREIAGGVWK